MPRSSRLAHGKVERHEMSRAAGLEQAPEEAEA